MDHCVGNLEACHSLAFVVDNDWEEASDAIEDGSCNLVLDNADLVYHCSKTVAAIRKQDHSQ